MSSNDTICYGNYLTNTFSFYANISPNIALFKSLHRRIKKEEVLSKMQLDLKLHLNLPSF